MRRMNDQRGATAVVVALLLVILMGFTALAVDVGAVRWDQKQVQNGADAAALAIAADCAKGACGTVQTTANNLADANTSGTGADTVDVDLSSNSVRVVVQATREHWFAPVLGIDSTDVPAAATATWGTPLSMGTVPITVSKCALDRAILDDPTKLMLLYTKTKGGEDKDNKKDKDEDEEENPCDTTNGPHVVPGGFQWLVPDTGCNVVTDLNSKAASSTGNTNPKECGEAEMNELMRAKEVLLPVFSTVEGNGSNAKYTLVSYAAMRVQTYCLTNKIHSVQEKPISSPDINKCTGSERWIEGYFVRHVALDAELGAGTNYGVTAVRLTD